MPNRFCVIIMCPVEETGKNSVSPSTIAIIITSSVLKSPIVILLFYLLFSVYVILHIS